ncbi:MAG: hypothetical protein HYZ27_04810 [Deltaproteobacteria bacterium]|nr:hypothetical protein [Deltaproteobacteria bacterium]
MVAPPGMPGTLPPAPARNAWRPVLIILSILGMMMFASCAACIIWLAAQPEGGVRAANQMERYATTYLKEHGILESGEKVVVYYDATFALDSTEAAILTDKRLVYHKDGSTEAISLAEIEAMASWDEGLVGDVIDAVAKDGTHMRIEIAPLNGGRSFIMALESQLKRVGNAAALSRKRTAYPAQR